jgi:tetratricopeptide (TPR) repeat protein
MPTSLILSHVLNRLSAALGIACLIGFVIHAAQSPQVLVVDVRLEAWHKAVEAHQLGKADPAARSIAEWDNTALLQAIKDFQREPPPAWFLKRGAVLHLDIARFYNPVARGALFPGRQRGEPLTLTALDGQRTGQNWLSTHVQMARELLDLVPGRERDETVRLWYIATGAYFAYEHNLAEALMHYEDAFRLFPRDPQLLLARGCLYETFASPRVQSVVREGVTAGRQLTVGAERHNLLAAERYFRDTLKADPGSMEARVRLGHVLGLQQRHREAVAALQQVTNATDPRLAYYALLVLGREEELLGRTDAARRSFERASALFPAAQSPLLALGRLAFHDGDPRRAEAALAPLFALGDDEVKRLDPWWDYYAGTGRFADRLLTQLYDVVLKEPR